MDVLFKIFFIVICGLLFLAGLFLDKIATIRKWQLEEERESV